MFLLLNLVYLLGSSLVVLSHETVAGFHQRTVQMMGYGVDTDLVVLLKVVMTFHLTGFNVLEHIRDVGREGGIHGCIWFY